MVWRTNTSNISFDNLRVTGSPASYNTLVYLHGDHLGSIGAVTNNSGALLDMTRFYPFGGFRGSDPAFLTERAFTGHKTNNTSSNDLGLIYMNTRYYVGSIGRFASADTLVPDQTDPQALNHYAYARNNPLLIVDPSGHCWGFAGFLRNTFYATTCNNLDMAVSIVQHPDASVGQMVAAGAYIAGEAVAHTVAVGGTIVAGVGCLTGAGTAICAGAGTAITAASADGNPTNEVAAAANVIQSVTADGDPTNEAQVLLRTVGNAQSAAMNVVRNIEKGERVGQLLDELKTLTFTTGNEHAIVRMSDGTRAMVSGGQGGINLTSEVSKVIIHTHPCCGEVFPLLGPVFQTVPHSILTQRVA